MTFIEDSEFFKRRSKLLNEEEFFRFVTWLISRPEAGDIIPGSGGLRKVRWAAKGKSKSGGFRVIYFWWLSDEKILLLDIYSKSSKENLTKEELKKLKGKIIP